MEYLDTNPASIQQAFAEFFNKRNIEEKCTEESLVRLHEAFLTSENEEMNISQLRDAFENVLSIKMAEDEFYLLFQKINLKRDDNATWDKFISYLLLEFQEKDTALQNQIMELPITGPPTMMRPRHRAPICRVAFLPEVLPDRSASFRSGCYVTISKDGVINYWSLDLEYKRSVKSTNPFLKVQSTVITDMIVMPDVQILCTSSIESDLRFYDTMGNKFDLRVLISCLGSAVVCMNYYFHKDINEDSYIVLGDTSGSVRILSFNPTDKGPFKHLTTCDLTIARYDSVLKGELEGLSVSEIKNIHSNWVNQVSFYGSLRAFMSSSRCCECSLLLSDPTGTRIQYKFKLNLGITCFTFSEDKQMLVTGGPDCIVRVWNPFVPKRPSSVFQGHHAAICAVIIQTTGKRIYSLSKDRCIRVWDVVAQSCIQTYNELPSELSEHTEMTTVYNTLNHKIIIASMAIAVVVCEPVVNEEIFDGFTHTKSVSCVLYNNLFKVVVTAGHDSCIIIWDPWHGRRLYLVTEAHSQLVHGQQFSVEITAACFDESEKLLVTGARDGTLKIWNFNTGSCMRNMAIESECEITSIVWLENRILCSGWNRLITEFAISDTNVSVYRKSWVSRHTDDILCSSIRCPQVLATASYNGELILWRLETGQAFRRYQVNDVTARFNVIFKKEEHVTNSTERNDFIREQKLSGRSSQRIASRHQESALNITRIVPVRAMLFLCSRPVAAHVGTLLVSLDSGLIQVWTHHPAGGFLTAFSVIHSTGDCALALATDSDNSFLVTGHSTGYIKVWLLANYMLPHPDKICMPRLRLEFPFLWKDRINGRAKRAVKDQPLPILLSSLRGHTKEITSVQVVSSARMIISGSTDHTVRLWTFGGRYISTLGTFKPWPPILPLVPVSTYFGNYRIPPDIKRFASFTTMKVLRGGFQKSDIEIEAEEADLLREPSESHALYGKKITQSLLDTCLKSKRRQRLKISTPALDNSLSHIPIYTHLIMFSLEVIEIPKSSKSDSREMKLDVTKKMQGKVARKASRMITNEKA